MLIKVCGMRDTENIRAVSELDIDLMGFIFSPKSPRYVMMISSQAGIIPDYSEERLKKGRGEANDAAHRIKRVGVFVDEPIENVIALAESGTIRIAQLHGSESEEYAAELKERGITVIRAFRVSSESDIAAARSSCADFVLLDSGGGSGETFDWSLIKAVGRNYFLAGGLTADNVADAVKKLRPYAVDASSCLETEGFKDFEKMRAFAEAVRTAE